MLGFPGDSDSKKSVCNTGDLGSNPGSERSPGEGNGSEIQYSCLEKPMSMRSQRLGHDWATLTFFLSPILITLGNLDFKTLVGNTAQFSWGATSHEKHKAWCYFVRHFFFFFSWWSAGVLPVSDRLPSCRTLLYWRNILVSSSSRLCSRKSFQVLTMFHVSEFPGKREAVLCIEYNYEKVKGESESCSVVSVYLKPHGLYRNSPVFWSG